MAQVAWSPYGSGHKSGVIGIAEAPKNLQPEALTIQSQQDLLQRLNPLSHHLGRGGSVEDKYK